MTRPPVFAWASTIAFCDDPNVARAFHPEQPRNISQFFTRNIVPGDKNVPFCGVSHFGGSGKGIQWVAWT
jgi:hypothetical protein